MVNIHFHMDWYPQAPVTEFQACRRHRFLILFGGETCLCWNVRAWVKDWQYLLIFDNYWCIYIHMYIYMYGPGWLEWIGPNVSVVQCLWVGPFHVGSNVGRYRTRYDKVLAIMNKYGLFTHNSQFKQTFFPKAMSNKMKKLKLRQAWNAVSGAWGNPIIWKWC